MFVSCDGVCSGWIVPGRRNGLERERVRTREESVYMDVWCAHDDALIPISARHGPPVRLLLGRGGRNKKS